MKIRRVGFRLAKGGDNLTLRPCPGPEAESVQEREQDRESQLRELLWEGLDRRI